MVDLHTKNNGGGDRREGKVKILMDRTPCFIKSKFWSVLGGSNDLINGLTNKLDITLSMSSSTETESAERDTNQNSKPDDVSLDDSLIDFESRKVKERRAYDEVSSGKYRHPNFVTKMAFEDCNMIDINPESSISTSHSNSVLSKSSNTDENPIDSSEGRAGGDLDGSGSGNICGGCTKRSICSTRHDSDEPGISVDIGDIASPCGSSHDHGSGTLSEPKVCLRSVSNGSVQSCVSIISLESQTENETLQFMRRFVTLLFNDSSMLTLELKSEFGRKTRTEAGRICFARLISAQRSQTKKVNENAFYSLVQHFAIVLFECADSDDFSPAKILMNMCFTFYYEVDVPGCEPYREYLYTYLRDQPIWHALRFWNAAFFDAVQCERSHRPVPQIKKSIENPSRSLNFDSIDKQYQLTTVSVTDDIDENVQIIKEDQIFLQNICFGQLGTFTCNMHAFGLSQELCVDFLKKQCIISNLTKEQEKMLFDNVRRMYKETAKWRN